MYPAIGLGETNSPICCSLSHIMDTIHIVPSVEAISERHLETSVNLPIKPNLINFLDLRSFLPSGSSCFCCSMNFILAPEIKCYQSASSRGRRVSVLEPVNVRRKCEEIVPHHVIRRFERKPG